MYSQYNYSPSAASLRLIKSTSAEKFYRQATERAQHYESALQGGNRDCLACRHEQQLSGKPTSDRNTMAGLHSHASSQRQQSRPPAPEQESENLRNSIRFLEDLLERNKREHRIALARSDQRIEELTQELQVRQDQVTELERKVAGNQLLQQYASASLVGTYVQKDDAEEKERERERERLQAKIKEMAKTIDKLQIDNENLKSAAAAQKQAAVEVESLQQRVRECEVYAREYESMKLLIHKMEMDRDETLKKHEKAMNELNKRHQEQLRILQDRVEEVREELVERERQLEGKEREIEKTRVATEQANHSQWEHLQELVDERNDEIDKLQSKLNCVESELVFLKNRYGYLLKMIKSTPAEPTSTSQLEDYCIERVGRHNISNGKESLMGLNLSPIKRR